MAIASTFTAGLCLAQPGGGMGGPGGGRPGAMPPGMAQAMKPPKLEDMLPPDSIEIWRRMLKEARGTLQASPEEWAAFDALLASVEQLSRSNERQLWRLLGKSRGVATAVPDLERDLRNSIEDLRDHLANIDDLRASFEQFKAKASEPLRTAVQGYYAQALRTTQNALFGGQRSPGNEGAKRPAP